MHGSALLTLTLAFLPLHDAPSGRVSAEQLELPRGVWTVVSVEADGQFVGPLHDKQVIIGAGTLMIPDEFRLGSDFTFELRAGRKFNAVDLRVKRGDETWTFRGIYVVEGEMLRVCCAFGLGPCNVIPLDARPTEFTAEAGTDQVVLTLRRK